MPDRSGDHRPHRKLLSDLGFISLVHCKNTDYAAFFGGQSVQKAKTYNTDSANANARLSTQLPYIFAVSRIAHYMKSIMRDKIGSFASRQNVQDFLNTWLAQYVLLDDSASQEAKAKYPLREARVDVVEVPGKPGVYRAAAFLRPHFQLDELTISCVWSRSCRNRRVNAGEPGAARSAGRAALGILAIGGRTLRFLTFV